MKRLIDLLRSRTKEIRTDGGAVRERSRVRRWLDSDFVQSAPFWLPPFLLMGFFVYAAIGWNLLLSLTSYSGFGEPDYSSLSLGNYWAMFDDPGMWAATRNTLVLLIVFTVACLAIGLALALLLDREIRFGRTLRTIYLLPFALSFIVTAQFWRWMYNVNNGIVNQFVGVFGLGPYNWLGDPRLVLGSVIFALVWQFSGYTMVIYLAALRSIPSDQYEAARVDGANTLRMYWRVIIPQLRPAMVSASVVLVLFALKAFDFLYATFDGYRPRRGADILATKMVREAFQRSEWAYGSAIAITLFVMSLAVIAPYLYNQYKRGNL
ncbi:carbohydrate ABC transporter permease [Natranaeroarchaeum aerophilus]|uniref:Sugar ABC transporter permease n=1 Tax=Natranaeroarchaeum aerophilus TaxID=2917711 RepID=A0AAE3K7F9_9EURY|nr:sugar ABC transporter permease [Natranaeroarchaeum aerophilus]MCL9813869.1 sugar ABC transporter permease [Natranaeroarchaeum aerophilus]